MKYGITYIKIPASFIAPMLCLLLLTVFSGYAQNDCSVLMESISDKYEGDCKNGKAHGMGKATGTDRYEGEFKKGLPDGQGRYTWANGDVYEGGWKDGEKHGDGKMTVKNDDGKDSVVSGTWKKDELAGSKKAYNIESKSGNINRIQITKTNGVSGEVRIVVMRMNRKVNISNLQIKSDNGNFFSDKFTVTKFPITVNIEFEAPSATGFGSSMERFTSTVTLSQNGIWEIRINLVNV